MKILNTQKIICFVLLAFVTSFAATAETAASERTETNANNAGFGIIKGKVLDKRGGPIADATVAILRAGTSRILKKVHSAADGSFVARIVPGTYTVLAVAQGFNPETFSDVQVGRFAELNYGFKLERAGSGNTLPEKRLDRKNPKWILRSATNRSIYQNQDGDAPIDEDTAEYETLEFPATDAADIEREGGRKGQTVVETFVASTNSGVYTGINAATLVPLGDSAKMVIAGQTAVGDGNAPKRFEANLSFRPNVSHQIRVITSFGTFGSIDVGDDLGTLSQISLQATDEWRVREGIVFVYGLDYSRFIGAGHDSAITPRLGLQFDVDAKTRLRAAYTTETEERSWTRAIELEDTQVLFREPVSMQDIAIENGTPQMRQNRRLEFGIERVLDNSSSIEANAFFDTTMNRGVGFNRLPFDGLGNEGVTNMVATQQGSAQGFRIVYTRRLNGRFSTSAGYSFGRGQRLSENVVSDPADLFESGYFQSYFGSFEADLRTGTNVKTVFRFSPEATVFAIDPFRGRLAIYDPSLSILITQNLPTLGLPFSAKAVVDARNIFDFQTGAITDEGRLIINSQRRMLRGGIMVRF